MNVLFFTLEDFNSITNYYSINADLLREFAKNDHNVFVVSPVERRKGVKTHILRDGRVVFLKQRIGNIQKTNIIEKGLSTITIERVLINGIKKHFKTVKFDLVLYCTPPITFLGAVEYVKKRDQARTYLLLKDIFPQNAVDLGMLSTRGIKGILYKHFRKKEKRLYNVSDRIGCMSEANVEYLLRHNPEIDPSIVEVCPNSIEVIDKSVDDRTRIAIREKYGIPLDKRVFVYGGNLGKPQGISFLIECMRACKSVKGAFFLIVGDGTEFSSLQEYINSERQSNIKLMKRLSKEDYDAMVGACDVGLLFLDYRFTIPNFPSRILSYMQAKIPVLACTDPNTDVGKTIITGEFGWWCESNDSNLFETIVTEISSNMSLPLQELKEKSFEYLIDHFSCSKSYEIIMNSLMEK